MNFQWMPKETVQAVTQLDLTLSVNAVPEIDTLLSKTVLFRGKKFRPMLCFLMGKLFQLSAEQLSPYARAAEFVHAATLAHDDVIDESEMRRNRPTLNARSSNARAILAGDLLLSRVMVELSALGHIQIIHDLARTVEDLVSGEWLQLEARKVISVTRAHLEEVARKKTSSLMIWSSTTPARLAGFSEEGVTSCAQFAETLGIAFQMIDDIIDFDKGGEKPFAQDIREGLVNFVTLEMLEHNPSLMHPIQKLLGQPKNPTEWPWQTSELAMACDRVRARACAKLESADQFLSNIAKRLQRADGEALQSLRSILVYLRERVR